MTVKPNLVVAGHSHLAQKLRNTGRFAAVFDVASASSLRALSKSGELCSPAAFMFAPDFDEDLPDAKVPLLASGLAASGFTVLVHMFFTERGDVFGPGVIAGTGPMSMADLLATLCPVQPSPVPDPPPESWAMPVMTPAQPPAGAQPRPPLVSLDAADVPTLTAGQELIPGWVDEEAASGTHRHDGVLEAPDVQQEPLPPFSGSALRAVGSGRRRRLVLASVASMVLVGGIGAAMLVAGTDTAERPSPVERSAVPSSGPAEAPTSSPTAVQPGNDSVPRQVRIDDHLVSIEVTWKDGGGSRASHYVVGGLVGHTPTTLASAPPGTTRAVVNALDPDADYCLTVVAVVDVDRVSRAGPVCTHRVKRKG
ncbi:hypothetical protein [Actinomadura montaniterrae]|uniref:Fibronectin type-III domain-containing protein n=1 Tax=Actinomadura montaniterrae TaxID=1803903 RepID=A0A6L3VYB5_9ACTN|nr:hypothetical protein [Actinomadura montaniterrae]KAB2385920.1 hypothetical protein F9B16_08955 [Actinomadura montaniterrae]